MFITIDQFKKYWKQETANTSKIFAALTDESLSQSINKDHRTLGRMAWHITGVIPDMMNLTNLEIEGPTEKTPIPSSADEILKAYEANSAALLEQVASKWSDDVLQVTDEMYGETWARSKTLFVLIIHEIHHRAQMLVLMRQAGLVVPGIYGPAKEEWKKYGMEEPAV